MGARVLPGLLDPDPDARSEAFEQLHAGILDDGDGIVEATAHVVPFLVELAASRETPDRPRLLWFLAQTVGLSDLDPAPDQAAADREAEVRDPGILAALGRAFAHLSRSVSAQPNHAWRKW